MPSGGPGCRTPVRKSWATMLVSSCSSILASKNFTKSAYVGGISFSATLKPRISCFISSYMASTSTPSSCGAEVLLALGEGVHAGEQHPGPRAGGERRVPDAVVVDGVEGGVHLAQPLDLGQRLLVGVDPHHHRGQAAQAAADRVGAEGRVLVDDRRDRRLHRLQQEGAAAGEREGDQADALPQHAAGLGAAPRLLRARSARVPLARSGRVLVIGRFLRDGEADERSEVVADEGAGSRRRSSGSRDGVSTSDWASRVSQSATGRDVVRRQVALGLSRVRKPAR